MASSHGQIRRLTYHPPDAPLRQRHGILRLRCELVRMRHLLACLAILAAFNSHSQVWNANADVDQDGCVGVGDVLQILSVYGSCEPASTCVSPTMDGYSYDVVEIGDQCWFAENLRTTIYANGDVIPAGLTDGEWTSNNTGATAVYGDIGRVQHDIFYIENWSFFLDLKIIFQTFFNTIRGEEKAY